LFFGCNLCVLPVGRLQQLSGIGHCACAANHNLRSVLIPASLVQIREEAFADCVSLSAVDFVSSSKLEWIGFAAFRGCNSLRRFRIVASVSWIAPCFLVGSGVHEVTVDSGNSIFSMSGGSLVKDEGKCIVCYFGEESDVRIGADIETVGVDSFAKSGFLRSVAFEAGSKLARIDHGAFSECGGLEVVRFAGRCPSFGMHCFQQCRRLKNILFESPSDRLPVDSNAFEGCVQLQLT
jgi:hypothetical protein